MQRMQIMTKWKEILTKEFLNEELVVFPQKNSRQLAEVLGCGRTTVGKYARKFGIQLSNRMYSVDDHFFDELNFNTAYLLGLSTADATVYGTSSKNSNEIKWEQIDPELVYWVRDLISPERPVYINNPNTRPSAAHMKNCKLTYSVRIISKIITDRLISLGIIPRRTGKETLLDLPLELHPAYLRGLFDGDGSIRLYFKGDPKRNINPLTNKPNEYPANLFRCDICCSRRKFLEDLQKSNDIFQNFHINKGCRCWVLISAAKDTILQFGKYIYSTPPDIRLARKEIKFEELRQGKHLQCEPYLSTTTGMEQDGQLLASNTS